MSACTIGGQSQPTDWSQQSSASSGGGLQELVKAARKEGALNLPSFDLSGIALSALEQDFAQKYGIKVNTFNVKTAADQFSSPALDAFSVAPDLADTHRAQEVPYLVFYWLEVPAALKNTRAYWYSDCGGYLSVGWDSSTLPAVTSLSDLSRPAYKDRVTLEGDPLQWDTGLAGVLMGSMASSPTPDAAAGVAFFQDLKTVGNFLTLGPAEGGASVMIGPEYDQAQLAKTNGSWKEFIPPRTVIAYNAQAINRTAPHPAAARLWEEYLFSDGGQNLCLKYGARPSRMTAMRGDGVLDLGAAAALPPSPSEPVVLSSAQFAEARAYVDSHWAAAAGQ